MRRVISINERILRRRTDPAPPREQETVEQFIARGGAITKCKPTNLDADRTMWISVTVQLLHPTGCVWVSVFGKERDSGE